MLVNIQALIDDAKCYEVVRQLRWPTGVQCPTCGATEIVKRGQHTHQAHRRCPLFLYSPQLVLALAQHLADTATGRRG